MDIDLNVNSESVFSGVFFLETIAMALEALGNVLASDIGICATPERSPQTCATQAPCEFPTQTCGASFCLICTCCVRLYDARPRVKVRKELGPLERVKYLPPGSREIERQGRQGRGADLPAHGRTPRRNERDGVEAEDMVEGSRHLFVVLLHQLQVAEPVGAEKV